VIGKISDMANSAVVFSTRHAPGDRLELPGWLCPRSTLRRMRSLKVKRYLTAGNHGRWMLSKRSPFVLSKVTACIPTKIKKTALERAEDRKQRIREGNTVAIRLTSGTATEAANVNDVEGFSLLHSTF